MKYPNDKYRAREGRALKAAQNLAAKACYRTFAEPAITPTQLRDALNVPAENLFLLPSGGDHPYRLEQAVREIRCMLLIIEPGSNMDGSPTFYFTLLRCVNGRSVVRYILQSFCLCSGAAAERWLPFLLLLSLAGELQFTLG